MKICYINRTVATIYGKTDTVMERSYSLREGESEQSFMVSAIADEGLYGMPLCILAETEAWYHVRTHYSYEGYIRKEEVLFKENLRKQLVVDAQCADVLSLPKVQGIPLISLTRGCLVEATEEKLNGYRKVVLLDGREGYIPEKYLTEKLFATDTFCENGTVADEAAFKTQLQQLLDAHFEGSEEKFRDGLMQTVIKYTGTQYRWGGKSPFGIDCSGLTSMTYMLNGVLTYRDASIVSGYPVKEIPRSDIKRGDLLYFPGHIAMYLGEDMYIHSTAKAGSNGVDINSFDPEDMDYRKDLDESLIKAGTIFW